MPDSHLPEDEAARYVMGGFTAAERAEFETRLAQSAELRALVRELEEGTVALAMAAPRKSPPSQVWKNIEQAVAKETKRQKFTALWFGWWRNGWAVAVLCLMAWLCVTIFSHITYNYHLATTTDSATNSQPQTTVSDPLPVATSTTVTPPQIQTAVANQLLQEKTREAEALRWQVVELSNQMAHLSQSVTQQQALLAESNRIKFFQMTSEADGGATAAKPLSPALQQAMFMAMAKQLGWLPPNTIAADPASKAPGLTASNQLNVDFVDLRPKTNAPSGASQLQNAEPQTQLAAIDTPAATETTTSVAAFTSGDDLVVAVDTNLAPTGTQLTFYTGTAGQLYQWLGSATLQENPMVVTLSAASAGGMPLTMFSSTSFGTTNVFRFNAPMMGTPVLP